MREKQRPSATLRARDLRKSSTKAERALWAQLRDRQLGGHKFRRQQPIGPYIVDFFCLERKLVVEVDGGQHGPEVDERRTAFLESEGCRVLRFWNEEVLESMDGVLRIIAEHLRAASPSRR
jgi:adenine-specific DNA-methyltransferase